MRVKTLSLLVAVVVGFGGLEAAFAGEAEDRKAHSVAILEREGVPFIDWLPLIETEAQSHRRTRREVVERTIALAIFAVKGGTLDHDLALGLVDQFAAEDFFSLEEQRLIADPAPGQHDRIQFSWRYEAVHVLLWALGIYPELGRPDQITDVPKLASVLRDLGTDGLLQQGSLRPQAELLDAADLIYRYHWATRDAELNGRPAPAGLDRGVVLERHWTLNWLVLDQPWDDVDTST